jgi:hypothetical protein
LKPITPDEILDLTTYEKRREEIRAAVMALKEPRRVAVGDRLTFIFENRDTVRFQVQEMVRAERLVKPEAIQAELDVYNELIPGDGELSATLMIEIPDAELIRRELDRLVGIDEYVWLDLGKDSIRATFDPKPSVPVALRVAHPSYTASAPIDGATRESLARDLEPEA